MKRYYIAGSLLLMAVVAVLGAPGNAQALLPGCVALGGVVVGTECRVTGALAASGAFEIESGLTLHLVNSGGVAGSITTGGADLSIQVHGDFVMDGGTLIDANKVKGVCNMGGAITLTVDGSVTVNPTAIIRSDSCSGGPIVISAQQSVDISGLVESAGSNKSAFGAINVAPGGGPITITSGCNLTITDDGVVSSHGNDPGADLVRLVGGCFVKVFGLVESTGVGHKIPTAPPNHCAGASRPGKPADSTACVEIVAGDLLVIDSTSPHNGQVNTDLGGVGGGKHSWIDLFAKGTIQVIGDLALPFSVHANSLSGNNATGGTITVKSRDKDVRLNGLALQSDALTGDGGQVLVEAKTDVTLDDAQVFARGDFNPSFGFGEGGQISGKAFNGALSWTDTIALGSSVGDVRPAGSGIPLAQRGTINLTACTTVSATGTSFPVNYFVVPPFPVTSTGACGGAPTFPPYITFPDCACAVPAPFVVHVEKKITCPTNDTTTAFTARISGGTVIGPTSGSITTALGFDFQVTAGTYTITEDTKTGWSNTGISCTGGVAGVVSVNVSNPNPTCTITNVSDTCAPGVLAVTMSLCPANDLTLFPVSASGTGTVISQSSSAISSGSPTVNFQVTPGTYSIAETVPGFLLVNGCLNKTVSAGETVNCTLTLTNPTTCQQLPFCNTALTISVLDPQTGRFPGNLGPDVIVDIRKQTLQSAVDAAQDTNGDGYVIVGVIGKDSQLPGGLTTQSLDITKTYSQPFAIIGCGVTIQDPDRCDGIAPIHIHASATSPPNPQQCGGPSLPPCATLYIQGITAIGSQSSPGWLIEGNGRYLESIGGTNDLLGIQITGDGNTLHHSVASTNLGGGVVVQGNGNILDDVVAVSNLGGDGIRVIGNSNKVVNSSAGAQSKGNVGNGITVNGKGNVVGTNTAYGNEADGINVSGGIATSPNIVNGNIAGASSRANGGTGIVLGGTGNGTASPIELEGNTAQSNFGGGIFVTGTGHQLKNNVSGGTGSKTNFVCQYLVAAGNINATGNVKGTTLIPGADGSPFPTGCQ